MPRPHLLASPRAASSVAWILLASALGGCASGGYAGAPAKEAPSYGGAAGYPMAQMTTGADAGDYDSVREEMAPMDPGAMAPAMAPPPPPMPVNAKAPAPAPPPGQGPTHQVGAGEDSRRSPILIYTADFTMSVFDVQKSLDAVAALATRHGGYLARRDDRSITVRIPAQRFQELVGSIDEIGDVLHRNVVSEDVTAEYRDLEVQLQNLLAMRARFEKLLEKAQKVEEALEIERELGRVTGEIERIKGRLKLLTDLAAYSTVTVSFEPRASTQVQEGPFVLPLPWLQNLGLNRLLSL